MDYSHAARLVHGSDGFGEGFLEMLGAREVCSIDASDYEGTTVIHDLNQPMPETLKRRFSVVLDGGALEHIFNFSTAVASCMEMVEVGGHFPGIAPTNNFAGHGFYQFGPELFFRVFTAANGFEVVRVILCEDIQGPDWCAVPDPALALERITVVNAQPTYLLVTAKKTADLPIFRQHPQQSDYASQWAAARSGSGEGPPRSADAVCARRAGTQRLRALLEVGGRRLARLLGRGGRPFAPDPRFFRRIDVP